MSSSTENDSPEYRRTEGQEREEMNGNYHLSVPYENSTEIRHTHAQSELIPSLFAHKLIYTMNICAKYI